MGRKTDDEKGTPWVQQADETEQWYARFLAFRDLGWGRTVNRAFEICAEREGLQARNPGAAWYRAAKRWQWEERAAAWDENRAAQSAERTSDESTAEPTSIQHSTPQPRPTAPLDRAGMITRLLMQVFQSLEAADLDGMDVQEARNKLPAIRMLFKDLLEMHRVETAGDEDDADTPAFTADELIAAQRELERWRGDHVNEPPQQNDEQL